MLRKHCWLPHDVVELILERLPVESLLRFKFVCKNWKSTIESPSFKQKQLNRRKQSQGQDVLFVQLSCSYNVECDAQRFVFGSSIVSTIKLPTSSSKICRGSCDGLLCLHGVYPPLNVVVNPATGWHHIFPLSNSQGFFVDRAKNKKNCSQYPFVGFGKDKLRGTFKAVCLYNYSQNRLQKNVSTCEVFDFSTNAWRYIVPASPYWVRGFQEPVYLDGSLYWLTEGIETNVLSFDLHTETFQVISKIPFPHVTTMCVLDDRLCVTQKNWPNQVIWWLDLYTCTWKEMFSIDLIQTLSSFAFEGIPNFVPYPIAFVEKKKFLFQARGYQEPVMLYDLDTKSWDLLFKPINLVVPICYFESLLSVYDSWCN